MFEVPEHLYIPVDEDGNGPLDADEEPYAIVCWCSAGQECTVNVPHRLADESAVNGDETTGT
jgi:hypothetical protein